VEAALEIIELKDIHEDWAKDMGSRLNRLSSLSEEAEKNRQELYRINADIAAFHGKQNEKAIKAVSGMNAQSNAVLLKTAFGGWSTWFVRLRGEQHIHEKFKAEIVEAKAKLKEIQGSSVSGVKRALMGNVEQSNKVLLGECVRRWAQDVKREKQDREARLKLATEAAHLETLRAGQKASAKRSMMRMAGEGDENLRSLCFTGWANVKLEEQKQKEFEEREAKLQQQLDKVKSRGTGGATGVIQRMSDASNTGLLQRVFSAWSDDTRTERRARNLEETIASQNAKFSNLNAKQKGNAKHAAQSAIELEEHNTMMNIFMNWRMEVEVSRVIMHYSGKMQGKQQQLEQVQSMFKDFASALDQGLSNTPRTEKRG